MYGPAVARLYEELIVVSAGWVDPQIRAGALQLHSDEEHQKTLNLLEEALKNAGRAGSLSARTTNLLKTNPTSVDRLNGDAHHDRGRNVIALDQLDLG